MKTEKEFLNGMWHKVQLLEREEIEKLKARQRNKRITIRKSLVCMISTLIFFAFVYNPSFLMDSIYEISLGSLILGFLYEYLSMEEREGKRYGN